jgi:hypothetical protein
MSLQSGSSLHKDDLKSLHDVDLDRVDSDFQEAVKWKRDVQDNVLPLRNRTRDEMFTHYCQALRAATVYRGLYLKYKPPEKERKP